MSRQAAYFNRLRQKEAKVRERKKQESEHRATERDYLARDMEQLYLQEVGVSCRVLYKDGWYILKTASGMAAKRYRHADLLRYRDRLLAAGSVREQQESIESPELID